MRNWISSLQFRLILSFALVLSLALGSVSVYLGYTADREVDRIQERTDAARMTRIQQTLSRFYSNNNDWQGLQSVAERAGFLAGREIVVVDEDGQTVADTRGPKATGNRMTGREKGFSPMMFGKRHIGYLLIRGEHDPNPTQSPEAFGVSNGDVSRAPTRPEPFGEFQDPPLTRFAEATNRSLILAGTAAGVAGILVVSLMSRQILGSVRTLNSAARRLGRGDLSQRVSEGGRDEIGQLGRTFNTMAEGLENAERQRRNLTADVAHELRTPLSNIQGYVEALRDGVLPPDGDTLDTIHQQVLHLSHLVEDLRLLAETEAGDFRLDSQPGSLVDAIRSSVEAIRPRAEAKGVDVSLEVPDEIPLFSFDRTRMTQVLGNLLENAVRHTPSGGGVTVSAHVENSNVSVAIVDGGEGIPEEALAHIFDRFYRVDASRARTTGGAGLGLTIARQLVEAHGGSIRAESTVGHGSRFVFDLPLNRESG